MDVCDESEGCNGEEEPDEEEEEGLVRCSWPLGWRRGRRRKEEEGITRRGKGSIVSVEEGSRFGWWWVWKRFVVVLVVVMMMVVRGIFHPLFCSLGDRWEGKQNVPGRSNEARGISDSFSSVPSNHFLPFSVLGRYEHPLLLELLYFPGRVSNELFLPGYRKESTGRELVRSPFLTQQPPRWIRRGRIRVQTGWRGER